MKADLTRDSFDPLKHFSGVLMQQGRVQLDADWNEQAAILRHMIRRLAADVLGSGGGPGFVPAAIAGALDDFALGAGTFYVDGIMCELESTPVPFQLINGDSHAIKVAAWTVDGAPYRIGQYLELSDPTPGAAPPSPVIAKIAGLDYANTTLRFDGSVDVTPFSGLLARARRVVTYRTQPVEPDQRALVLDPKLQAYLDVWERVVTPIQDDSIREVALNGPDTAARTQVVWQVRTMRYLARSDAKPGAAACMTPQAIENALRPDGVPLLRAFTPQMQPSTDPCTISPESRYVGPENQLYRVEIHTAADGPRPPTFKWSREDGSVAFAIAAPASGTGGSTVTLASLGRDDRFGLAEGDYVEIEDDRSAFAAVASPLLQVQAIDRTSLTVTLSGSTPPIDLTLHPLLRRWDHKAGKADQGGLTVASDGAAQIFADKPLNLEDGIQVTFSNAKAARRGDYWLIPARVATGDVIWPREQVLDPQGTPVIDALGRPATAPVARPPHGVVHHYAPLGIVTATSGTTNATVTPCAV